MTADKQLPVFVVVGPNWQCEVQLDEDDAEFSHEEQAQEAVTKALEALTGLVENYTITKPDDEDVYVDALTLTYLKNSNKEETTEFVKTYEAYANAGLYHHAYAAKNLYDKGSEQMEAAFSDIENVRHAELAALEQLEQDLQELKRLREDIEA